MPRMSGLAFAGAALAAALFVLPIGSPVEAQEKPGDAELCYKSVTAAEVTLPQIIAACSRVIANPGKAKSELATAHNNRGTVFLHTGQLPKAIEDFDAAIDLDPGSAMALANRGEAYRLQRDYDKALADEEAAIRLDPKLELG